MAITVTTSPTAFLPCSFDSPPDLGRISTATDPLGRTVEYRYETGDLVAVVDLAPGLLLEPILVVVLLVVR